MNNGDKEWIKDSSDSYAYFVLHHCGLKILDGSKKLPVSVSDWTAPERKKPNQKKKKILINFKYWFLTKKKKSRWNYKVLKA